MEERRLRPRPSPILQPSPRRTGGFSLTPLTTTTEHLRSQTPSPNETMSPTLQHDERIVSYLTSPGAPSDTNLDSMDDSGSRTDVPKKSRSILNLTSSTLFGIYSSDRNSRGDGSTPAGSGAQTPTRHGSLDPLGARLAAESTGRTTVSITKGKTENPKRASGERQHRRPETAAGHVLGLLWRAAVLFLMGMAYGQFVTHLHDTGEVAPVQLDVFDRHAWPYLVFWGSCAVVTGTLLPWMDGIKTDDTDGVLAKTYTKGPDLPAGEEEKGDDGIRSSRRSTGGMGADWNPIVRTIGAFVGIAFAIRRLPWQSTLQVSLTLALVNPFLWYLIDRSQTGFALSSVVGISGAAAILSINPNIVPSPAAVNPTQTILATGITSESIGVATWISSVLFCSCICFGNLGRRLHRTPSAPTVAA